MPPLVSAIIPTYNRAQDVCIAIGTILAQTYPAIEIIVVDDGSTDETPELLRRKFGDRIRYLPKPNGGVSSARNVGLAVARGDYLTLLDSDDEWLPTHVETQLKRLEQQPELGMVLTDVMRMDSRRVDFEYFHRRDFIPEDGDVLRWVVRNPTFVPASAMFTRGVYQDVGGFDETLSTAEDLDFHLRVALRWKIAIIEEPLTRAMRGHDGLSATSQSNRDYVTVITRFVESNRRKIDWRDRDAALLNAYTRNARGMVLTGEVRKALACAASGALRVRSLSDAAVIGKMGITLAKSMILQAGRALRPQQALRHLL